MSPHGPRLTIVRQAKSDNTPLGRFVDAAFSKRCARAESVPRMFHIEPGSTEFERAVIDGHPALMRGYCWRADAIVDLDDAFLVMTLKGGQVGPRGGRWTLSWFAEGIDIDAGPTVPEPSGSQRPGFTWTEPFTSERYGYSIRYPAGWIPSHLDTDGSSDEFYAPGPSTSRLSIVRRPKAHGMTLDEIALDIFSARSGPDGCHWNSAGVMYIPTSPQPFSEATIDGRPALVRSECGFVDAVVDDAEDVLLVVLRSGSRTPTGDRWNFDRFMETLEVGRDGHDVVDAHGPSGGTEKWKRFQSTHHGYTIRYPPDWIARKHEDGRPDWFFALPSPGARLSIVRIQKPNEMSMQTIAEHMVPDRAQPGGCHWFQGGPSQPFAETTLAGRPALKRSECGVIDAVIDDGEAVVLVTLRPGRYERIQGRWSFDQFMETLEVDLGED